MVARGNPELTQRAKELARSAEQAHREGRFGKAAKLYTNALLLLAYGAVSPPEPPQELKVSTRDNTPR